MCYALVKSFSPCHQTSVRIFKSGCSGGLLCHDPCARAFSENSPLNRADYSKRCINVFKEKFPLRLQRRGLRCGGESEPSFDASFTVRPSFLFCATDGVRALVHRRDPRKQRNTLRNSNIFWIVKNSEKENIKVKRVRKYFTIVLVQFWTL